MPRTGPLRTFAAVLLLLGVLSGCGGREGGAGRSPATTGNTPAATTSLPSGTVVVRTRRPDPYELLGLTAALTRRNGFALAAPPALLGLRVSRSRALAIVTKDFPSRVKPKVLGVFATEFEAFSRHLSPPYHVKVPCWAVVWPGLLPGVATPMVGASGPRRLWTAILIDGATGAVHAAFAARSRLDLRPLAAGQ